MVLAAEFGSGQVLWSIVWFSLFAMWVWLVLILFADIARSDTLSGPGKAVWAFGILVLPVLGAILYLIVNGDEMGRRVIDDVAAGGASAERAVGARTTAEGLAGLAAAHDAGEISDAEFAQAKARLLAP